MEYTIGIYGGAREISRHSDARVYRVENETGSGEICAYRVFDGIELYYNSLCMEYCCKNQQTEAGIIEINHCLYGRYECDFGETSCCYMTPNDMSIAPLTRKKSFSCFPLGVYGGITILIDFAALSPEFVQTAGALGIRLEEIRCYICEENRCCVMRAAPETEHIFSELYSVDEARRSGYIKLKTLELLLFLSDTDSYASALPARYLNRARIERAKETAALVTRDLSRRYTIDELARRAGVSPTALKNDFRGVFGSGIYAYLRAYRMHAAQKLLSESQLSVAELAARVGYENPNKFSSAFKSFFGLTPTEYKSALKTGARLDSFSSVR